MDHLFIDLMNRKTHMLELITGKIWTSKLITGKIRKLAYLLFHMRINGR